MRDSSVVGSRGAARFTGTLDDLSVADLIQILQLAGKSALITITREADESRLWCHEGAIIAAESGRLRGEAAVYRILSFEQGAIVADLQPPAACERSIFAATQRLLLEGARRKDESALLREQLGDLQRCVRLREPAQDPEPDASALELELLASFARPRSLQEAVDESELGDFETLTALVHWLEIGQLRDTGERHTPAPRQPRSTHSELATASLSPLVASAAPRPMRGAREQKIPSWGWGALAALLLAPAGYMIGSNTARSQGPAAPRSAQAAPEPRSAGAVAEPGAPIRHPHELRVEPAHAEIWLDGRQLGRGRAEMVLARDGAVHELQISAGGHVPARILLLDAPPPRELRLDPLPEPATAPPEAPATHPAPPAPAAGQPPKGRKRAALRAPPKREAARPVQRAQAPGAADPVADAPRVQIIEGDAPFIRVLD